jgi:hypothetical protein
MKRTAKAIVSFIFIALLAPPAFSQTLKDFFTSDATTALYLGIDFTKAKLIDDATTNETDIRDRQFAGINELIITDSKHIDVAGSFHKKSMDHDLGEVDKKNLSIDPSQIKSTNTSDFHRLKEDDISALVKGYSFSGKTGIGILFVMEAMSKSGKAAAIWVTFIDMKSKKVLLTERMEEKTGMSFGFKNYWAAPVKKALDEIDGDRMKQWKNKYQ